MSENEFIIVDVETTGFRPNEGHTIIEIAAERLLNEKIIDEFHSLIIPEQPLLDKEAQLIHGISDELLQKEGRPDHVVIPEFIEFAKSLPLIGHNISFDVSFINSHLTRLNQPALSNKTIDTVQLARKYLIIPSYSLGKVAAYLKVPQPSAHRAKVDVEVTRQVFLKLNERAQLRKR